MAMSIRKYIYASLALICLMCSCDPWLVPPVKITYEEDANGYKYVDLGLSVKWAAYDIGANSVGELGHFFAWGETQPKDSYSWDNYKFGYYVDGYNPNNGYYYVDSITKYSVDKSEDGSSVSQFYDGKTKLDLMDDAAHINWGGNWRMPTTAEFDELSEKCDWTWTDYMGIEGYDVKGPNGNRIFMPAQLTEKYAQKDYADENEYHRDYVSSYRWTSNMRWENEWFQYNYKHLYAGASGGAYSLGVMERRTGCYVRAVLGNALPKFSVVSFDANGGKG
ncbi:MAG: hypothetical protein J6R21_04960, partial [Bacteroidales bacterium]|nr:hypothetical protein [Bacteroidales bacterium]